MPSSACSPDLGHDEEVSAKASTERPPAQPAHSHARAAEQQREVLYAGLLDGMHSMAQPLTVLQARLHLAAAARNDEHRDHLTSAIAELEQMCTLFRWMQELVSLAATVSVASQILLDEILETFAGDAQAILAGSGLGFELSSEPGLQALPARVLADRERVRKGMVAALMLARATAAKGAVLRCSVAPFRTGSLKPTITVTCAITTAGRSVADLDECARLQAAIVRECLGAGSVGIGEHQLQISVALARAA